MLTVALIVAALAVLVAVVALAEIARARRPRRMLERRLRETLIVHRYNAPSIRGILLAEHDDNGLELRHAEVLVEPSRPGDERPAPVPLAGEVFVRWSVIDSVQVLPAIAATPARPAAVEAALPEAFALAPADPRPLRSA